MTTAPALILRFPTDDPLTRDLAAADIDATGAAAIHDAEDLEWRVFYQTREARDAAREALGPFARAHGLTIAPIEVEDEDWARRSQAQLTAVRVGDIIVAPPWDRARRRGPQRGSRVGVDRRRGARRSRAAERERPFDVAQGRPELAEGRAGVGPREQKRMRARNPGEPIEIVIEPSVGFGTGHHASTRLCLLALQQLDLAGKSVIDVGTGSGVLAIAALKLGAAHVTAIDSDADALANARENAAHNGVSVDFHVADVAAMRRPDLHHLRPSAAFDVVLANLTAAWLRRLSAPLLTLAADRSTFVLSGLQTSERGRVLEAFLPSRRLERELEEEGWIALVLQ